MTWIDRSASACVIILALGLVEAGCAQDEVPADSGQSCSFGPVRSRTLSLAGTPVYVNPEAVGIRSDTLLLAGSPNYVWKGRGPVVDGLFGVIAQDPDALERIPSPLNRPISTRYVIPARPEGWQAVFVETPMPAPSGLAEPVALWKASWTDSWRGLEPLVLPVGYELPSRMKPEDGVLVPATDGAWFGLVVDPRDQLMVAHLADGRRPESTVVPGSSRVLWLDAVTTADGEALFVFMLVDERTGWTLAAVSPSQDGHRLRELFHQPESSMVTQGFSAVATDSGLAVLVARGKGTFAYVVSTAGQFEQIALEHIPADADIFLEVLSDGAPTLIWQRRRLNGGSAALHIETLGSAESGTATVFPSPFATLQAASSKESGLTLVGTVFPPGLEEGFVTAVAHIPVRCEVDMR